jgi:serine protease Do
MTTIFRKAVWGSILLALVLALAPTASAQTSPQVTRVVEPGRVIQSDVGAVAPQSGERVYAAAADSTFVLEMSTSAGKAVGTAMGFLVADHLVLTNAHVANAGTISVRTGSLQVTCVTKRVDPLNDLALCEMAAKSSSTPIKLAATDPSPGATVYALGNPRGLEKTISQGLFTGVREADGRRVAQISAAISPGSSGGPILNSSGELVGVAVFYLKDGQALNFAVPLDIVRDFIAGEAPSASDHASLLTVVKGLTGC